MKPIKVCIHSVIDIITNSSTEIFVGTHKNTIPLFKEFINQLLKDAGSDQTCEDIYDVELKYNKYEYNDLIEELIEDEECTEEEAKTILKDRAENDCSSYETKLYLHITKKSDNSIEESVNITKKIYDMFDVNEWCD
jgi:hypothetical protein